MDKTTPIKSIDETDYILLKLNRIVICILYISNAALWVPVKMVNGTELQTWYISLGFEPRSLKVNALANRPPKPFP